MSDNTITMLKTLGIAGITFLVGWIIIGIIIHIEKKGLEKSKLDVALHLFVVRATKIILWIMLIITALPKLGVNVASLVAVLGASGAAIALALKDSLGNIAGGIIILINKPFNRGDTIEIAGTVGIVDNIDLLTTNLHTFDNKVVIIPNGTITNSIIMNYSREEKRRVDCVFGVSYNSDIDKVKALLTNIANENPNVLLEPAPTIGVSSHGDNAVQIDFKVWCYGENYLDVLYSVEEEAKKVFDRENIDIPFPQMDIHMVK